MAEALQIQVLLTNARKSIGTSYSEMDCSAFVHKAFSSSGMNYPHMSSKAFPKLAEGPKAYFRELGPTEPLQSGDVVAFKQGHMGIWDPAGCQVLSSDSECVRLAKNAPFLSSRGNEETKVGRGPSFGRLDFFKGEFKAFRWLGVQKTN